MTDKVTFVVEWVPHPLGVYLFVGYSLLGSIRSFPGQSKWAITCFASPANSSLFDTLPEAKAALISALGGEPL